MSFKTIDNRVYDTITRRPASIHQVKIRVFFSLSTVLLLETEKNSSHLLFDRLVS